MGTDFLLLRSFHWGLTTSAVWVDTVVSTVITQPLDGDRCLYLHIIWQWLPVTRDCQSSNPLHLSYISLQLNYICCENMANVYMSTLDINLQSFFCLSFFPFFFFLIFPRLRTSGLLNPFFFPVGWTWDCRVSCKPLFGQLCYLPTVCSERGTENHIHEIHAAPPLLNLYSCYFCKSLCTLQWEGRTPQRLQDNGGVSWETNQEESGSGGRWFGKTKMKVNCSVTTHIKLTVIFYYYFFILIKEKLHFLCTIWSVFAFKCVAL